MVYTHRLCGSSCQGLCVDAFQGRCAVEGGLWLGRILCHVICLLTRVHSDVHQSQIVEVFPSAPNVNLPPSCDCTLVDIMFRRPTAPSSFSVSSCSSARSDREVHQAYPILHDLQLREQNHPSLAIAVHEVPIRSAQAGADRGSTAGRRGQREVRRGRLFTRQPGSWELCRNWFARLRPWQRDIQLRCSEKEMLPPLHS